MLDLTLRIATKYDIDDICELFRNTVLEINKADYAASQLRVWSASADKKEMWEFRIVEQYFLLAIHKSQLVGFASLATDGYLDFMYIHHQFQRNGIAACLYNAIELKAIEQKNEKIYSEVSITARPFFEKQGFFVITKQQKLYADVVFKNYKMEKRLNF